MACGAGAITNEIARERSPAPPLGVVSRRCTRVGSRRPPRRRSSALSDGLNATRSRFGESSLTAIVSDRPDRPRCTRTHPCPGRSRPMSIRVWPRRALPGCTLERIGTGLRGTGRAAALAGVAPPRRHAQHSRPRSRARGIAPFESAGHWRGSTATGAISADCADSARIPWVSCESTEIALSRRPGRPVPAVSSPRSGGRASATSSSRRSCRGAGVPRN